MNRTNILWIGLLGGALLFGCSDSDDTGTGGSAGTGGAGGSAGTGGAGGGAGTGGAGGGAGTGGVGGIDGAFGVINVDFMQSVMPMADELYVGDDGVLSSPGGTYWNPADATTSVIDADDELGAPTPVDFVVNASCQKFMGDAENELQDNGICNLSDDPMAGFDWRDLDPDGVYDLAFYIFGDASPERWTTFEVTHAGGTDSLGPSVEPTWGLPGEAGKDYLLLEDLSPYEISAGVYGFRIDHINWIGDGTIMGAQIKRAP